MFLKKDRWIGKLELNFSLLSGRSVLKNHTHSGPFFVQKSFYSENDKITPHVYLLHPPGGLVGGDYLILSVKLDPGSRALLTTPSSTKFYRTNGLYALQKHIFKLANDACLEWLPQSSIFFPKTKVKINTMIQLEKGSRIIFLEMLCFGDLNFKNGSSLEEVDMFLDISLPDSYGLRDRLKMNALDCMSKLGGFRISASLFAAPVDETILKQVRKLIKSIKDIQIGGVTLLDKKLLVIRLLGNDNEKIKELLYQIWSIIRPYIIGKKAVAPRIWFT